MGIKEAGAALTKDKGSFPLRTLTDAPLASAVQPDFVPSAAESAPG